MLKTVLFDLDGTLLPMEQTVFVKDYLGRLAAHMAPHGYEPKELIETVWKGSAAMVANDGSRTNEAVFKEVFLSQYGERITADFPKFDVFYEDEFQKVKGSTSPTPMAKKLIEMLKAANVRLVLATNPLFPKAATESRIRWAGLSVGDFDLVTTYENSRHCKPNPDYYRDILGKLGCSAQDCCMVGNDVGEDMIAAKLGMDVFLLTDCLINKTNEDISRYPHGDFPSLMAYLSKRLAT